MRTLDKPINDVKEEYLAALDIKENSRKVYRKILNYFITWMVMNKVNPSAIRTADIITYKNYLILKKRSPYYINLTFAVIKQMFKWLQTIGWYDDVGHTIKVVSTDKRHTKEYLSKEMIVKLLGSIDQETNKGIRDRAVILLMSVTGIRCVEASRLTIGDIKTTDNYKTIDILGKGESYKRTLAIPDRVYLSLVNYIDTRPDPAYTDPLFIGRFGNALTPQDISVLVKSRMTQAGLTGPKLSAHSLRHSAAINSLLMGESIYTVQKMLGHKSVSTTEIYLKALEKERHTDNSAVRALDKAYM